MTPRPIWHAKTHSLHRVRKTLGTMKVRCNVLYGRHRIVLLEKKLLRSFGSRRILIFPFFLGTASIDEIHCVGFDTGSMTPALLFPQVFFHFIAKGDLTLAGFVLNWLGWIVKTDMVLTLKQTEALIENIGAHLYYLLLSMWLGARHYILNRKHLSTTRVRQPNCVRIFNFNNPYPFASWLPQNRTAALAFHETAQQLSSERSSPNLDFHYSLHWDISVIVGYNGNLNATCLRSQSPVAFL